MAEQMDAIIDVDDGEDYRLNVKDAVKYLDRVRQVFTGQPEVYNQFLEVMKGFKADT